MIVGVSVSDVMRRQAVAVRERARLAEIAAAMRRFHISCLPVIDGQDCVIGMISGYDLLLEDGCLLPGRGRRWLGRLFGHGNRGVEKVATELMSTPAVTVTDTTPARDAAREMYRHRIHQLPVVDTTTHRLIGIVTRSDLLAVYERPDEDIRHEILYAIIGRTLGLPPEAFDVHVVSGTVTIRGRLERRSAALRLAEAMPHVDGVITVIDHLTYDLDDTASGLSRG